MMPRYYFLKVEIDHVGKLLQGLLQGFVVYQGVNLLVARKPRLMAIDRLNKLTADLVNKHDAHFVALAILALVERQRVAEMVRKPDIPAFIGFPVQLNIRRGYPDNAARFDLALVLERDLGAARERQPSGGLSRR